MKPYSVLAAVLLSGCVTIDPIVESDFMERVIPVDYDTALKNIRQGWQVCTAPQLGSPYYLQFGDHTTIDIYGVSFYLKANTGNIIGKVELWALPNGTKVRSAIPASLANRQRRQNWIQWAMGNYQCKW